MLLTPVFSPVVSQVSCDLQLGPADTTDSWSTGFIRIDRAVALGNNCEIGQLGAYLTTAKTISLYICRRDGVNSYNLVAGIQSQSHGGSGWEDFSLSSSYTVPASGSYYLGMFASNTGIDSYTTTRAFDTTASDPGLGALTTDSENSGKTGIYRAIAI